jgi:signal peptidase I
MMQTNYRMISLEAIQSILQNGGEARLRIDGSSMKPCLGAGDIVVVREVLPTKLVLGDILVTHRGNDLVTHRLVAVDGNGWYTKGDNLPKIDPPVPAQAIIGRVNAEERNGSVRNLHSGWSKSIHSMIAWLSLQEGLAHQRFEGVQGGRSDSVHRAAPILSLPFRLPIWVLAVFRR